MIAGNERGLALLSAILSVALLTLIVVEMTDTTFVHSHLARNAGNAIAAQLLARSAETGAEELLLEDRRIREPNHPIRQVVQQGLPPVPVGAGTVAVLIRDEGGKLDLNQLKTQRPAFEKLFDELGIDQKLLQAVAVRIGQPLESEAGRSPAADCSLPIPCEPPIAPLRSIDDLLTIRGFSPAIVEALRPYATAIPGRGQAWINVNSAPTLVLQAAGCRIDRSAGEPPRDYADKKEFEDEGWCDQAAIARDTTSDVFSILAVGSVGDATQSVRATVSLAGGRIQRLAWKEQPVLGPAPDTVR